jgi:hypothetical protein
MRIHREIILISAEYAANNGLLFSMLLCCCWFYKSFHSGIRPASGGVMCFFGTTFEQTLYSRDLLHTSAWPICLNILYSDIGMVVLLFESIQIQIVMTRNVLGREQRKYADISHTAAASR